MHRKNLIRTLAAAVTLTMVVAGFAACKTEETTVTQNSTLVIPDTSETTAVSESKGSQDLGPASTAKVTERVVDTNGQLSVKGTQLVNAAGEPIVLKGMSSYELGGVVKFFNKDVVKTLAEDWGCSVLRLAMTTVGQGPGYVSEPDRYFADICTYIDNCIDQGIYVIADWHILGDCDPTEYEENAIDFFTRLSEKYGDTPNIIYEICNEPNRDRADGTGPVDWSNTIKPYAEKVIKAIRANDPDNVIVVGTPNWSQDVDVASRDPIKADNIMYTLHFYAGSHGQEFRDKIVEAMNNGCAVFVTEWGTTKNTGRGALYLEESTAWLDFLADKKISWCNWSIGCAFGEASNALKMNTERLSVQEQLAGHWPDGYLTDSGYYVRSQILGEPYVPRDN